MSSIYSMEPRPNGKVTLMTTYGPLSVELWGKECPLACRNFIQLCLEGYYDGSPFHRLVPGFCLQGGKPLRSSFVGESIYPDGGLFAVEVHSRLKFSRRGLMGMVALDPSNVKATHGSQFFFTLSETPELNGKATLFGRIVGDTIFNLLRMAELEIDPKTEAPLYPPKIISAQVTQNPFNDIIPREVLNSTGNGEKQPSEVAVEKIDNLKKRNSSLLSFADDEDVKGDEVPKIIMRTEKASTPSSHPSATSPISNNPAPAAGNNSSSLQFLQQMKAVQMRETQDKIKQMEEELGLRPKSVKVASEQGDIKAAPIQPAKPLSALEKYKARFSEKKQNHQKKNKPAQPDEMDTILMLNSFRQKIQKVSDTTPAAQEQNKQHLDICKLHGLINCLSCQDTFNVNLSKEPEDFDEKDWMMHKLVFDRRQLESQIRNDLRDLVVIDPREQAEKIAKQQQRQSHSSKK